MTSKNPQHTIESLREDNDRLRGWVKAHKEASEVFKQQRDAVEEELHTLRERLHALGISDLDQ